MISVPYWTLATPCGHWSCMISTGTLTTRASTNCSPFALLPQAKRRLALDDSDHQHQSEPIRTPRGKAATANGTRIKAPRSEQLRPPACMYLSSAARLGRRSTTNSTCDRFYFIQICVFVFFFFLEVFAFCWTVHSVKSWPSRCWQMLAVCTKLPSKQAHLAKMLVLSTCHV